LGGVKKGIERGGGGVKKRVIDKSRPESAGSIMNFSKFAFMWKDRQSATGRGGSVATHNGEVVDCKFKSGNGGVAKAPRSQNEADQKKWDTN